MASDEPETQSVCPGSPDTPKLHQVVHTWSPYDMLSIPARTCLRSVWRRLGFNPELAGRLRFEVDMALLRAWCKLSFQHRRQVKALRRRRGLKVHLGCGNDAKPGWVNVDCYPPARDAHCDLLVIDMRGGLPFADRSVDAIYSEHMFEHIPLETTRAVLLPECFRVLAPGGAIRLGVPDGELWMEAYAANRATGARSRFISNQPTPMMSVNDIARGYGHCFLWDYETLKFTLEETGFSDLRKRRAGETGVDRFVSLDQDDEWRVAQTVYIEGRRPGMQSLTASGRPA